MVITILLVLLSQCLTSRMNVAANSILRMCAALTLSVGTSGAPVILGNGRVVSLPVLTSRNIPNLSPSPRVLCQLLIYIRSKDINQLIVR